MDEPGRLWTIVSEIALCVNDEVHLRTGFKGTGTGRKWRHHNILWEILMSIDTIVTLQNVSPTTGI